MTSGSTIARRPSRLFFGLGLGVLLAGLPLAVEFAAPEDGLRSAVVQAGSGDTLVLSRAISLPAVPGLILERGTLRSLDVTGVAADRLVPKLQLDGAVFKLHAKATMAASSGLSLEPAQALGPLLNQLALLNVGALAVRRSSLTITLTNGRHVLLSEIMADITASGKDAYFAKGAATFNSQVVRFEMDWSRAADSRPSARLPLRLSVKSHLLDATFDGRLGLHEGLRLQGTTAIEVRKVRALARWFGLASPGANDLRTAKLSGTLDWSEGRLAFANAKVSVDGNAGEGALTLKTGGPRPAIEGTVAFKVFDIEPHISSLMTPELPAPAIVGQVPVADVPLTLLSALDADLRLSASKVIAPLFETGRGAVTITLRKGLLLADLAELEIEGGTAGGQITLDVNSDRPRLGVKGKLAGVDPGRVFTSHIKRNPLFGRANIAIDGFGSGPTLAEIVMSFSGKGTFNLVENGRLGVDLKALAWAAQKVNHVGWLAAGKGATPLEQLEARFLFSNGALALEGLQARSGAATFIGAGKVDLLGQLLDVNLAVVAAATTETPITAQEVLAFRGPWSDPAISLMGRPFTTTAPAVKGATMVPTTLPPLPVAR